MPSRRFGLLAQAGIGPIEGAETRLVRKERARLERPQS